MSERETREVEPGIYVVEYSDAEKRELYGQMPEGLEFLEEHRSLPKSRSPFARLWRRLFADE
jgi:hypothetical protein